MDIEEMLQTIREAYVMGLQLDTENEKIINESLPLTTLPCVEESETWNQNFYKIKAIRHFLQDVQYSCLSYNQMKKS